MINHFMWSTKMISFERKSIRDIIIDMTIFLKYTIKIDNNIQIIISR